MMKKLWQKWTDYNLTQLHIRNEYNETFDRKRLVFWTVLIMGQSFFWYAWFVHVSELYLNMSFVLFTFLLFYLLCIAFYRFLEEREMSKSNDKTYNKWVIIHNDIVKVLCVFSLTYFILFTYHLSIFVPVSVMVILLLLFIASFIYSTSLEGGTITYGKSFFKLLISGLMFSYMIRVLFIIVGTSTVHETVFYSIFILFILYSIKSVWTFFSRDMIKYNLLFSVVVTGIFLPFYMSFDESVLNFQGERVVKLKDITGYTVSPLIYTEVNYEEDIFDDIEIDDVFMVDGVLHVKDGNHLHIFNEDGGYTTLEPDLEVYRYIHIDGENAGIKALVHNGDVLEVYNVLPDSTTEKLFEFDFYYLPSHYLNEVFDEYLLVDVIRNTNIASITDLEGNDYELPPLGVLFDLEPDTLLIMAQEDDFILYEFEDKFYYHTSNVLENSNLVQATYNNGKIIYEELDYFYVQDVKDYLEGDTGKQLPFYERRIMSFYYEDGLYYFFLRSFTNDAPDYQFVVVNSNMRVIHQTRMDPDTKLFENYFLTYSFSNKPLLVDIDNPLSYYMTEDAEYMNTPLLIYWLLILFTLPFKIPAIATPKRRWIRK